MQGDVAACNRQRRRNQAKGIERKLEPRPRRAGLDLLTQALKTIANFFRFQERHRFIESSGLQLVSGSGRCAEASLVEDRDQRQGDELRRQEKRDDPPRTPVRFPGGVQHEPRHDNHVDELGGKRHTEKGTRRERASPADLVSVT